LNKQQLTNFLKQQSLALGFSSCGISKAEYLEEDAPRLEKWLRNNMHGQMQYMENHFDKRLNPKLLVPGAKTVISLMYNYFPSQVQEKGTPSISKYAYGKDYHFVIKEKLTELFNRIKEKAGTINGRVFVDSAPVLDKVWARKSNLGWIGKNSNLIHPKKGSFFFLAELIIDLELDYETQQMKDYCGTCTKCIDACPTDAIVADKVVDGSKCISYFTIELKEQIPTSMVDSLKGWLFGCDICQDVCPWNRFSLPHKTKSFEIKEEIRTWSNKEWIEMTEETFDQVFKDSPINRTGYKRIVENAKLLKSNG